MQNKFFKTIFIIIVILFAVISLTYFIRTVIDIGCAKTGAKEGEIRRRFIGVNCWFWEKAIHFQEEF